MGQHATALPLLERALLIKEAHLGPDHSSTLIRVWNVALLHMKLDNHEVAARMLRRLLMPTIQLPHGLDRKEIARALSGCTVHHPLGLQKSAPKVNAAPKVGRNGACPCGSGKKYKKCHGK